MDRIDRRKLLELAMLLPVAVVTGCAGGPGGYAVDEGVRRLLTLSSQRAFGRLLAPGGFYDSEVARIKPPEALGGRGDVMGAILQTGAVRRQLAIALNDVAGEAAERATPVVLDSIRGLTIPDAVAVLRGGPTAATSLLQQRAGGAVLDALLPGVTRGLRSDLAEMAGAALAARTGIDYVELGQTVAAQASDGIFRAIGREEAAIRADPRSTRDPVLIALLGTARP